MEMVETILLLFTDLSELNFIFIYSYELESDKKIVTFLLIYLFN